MEAVIVIVQVSCAIIYIVSVGCILYSVHKTENDIYKIKESINLKMQELERQYQLYQRYRKIAR